jgi:hypothetical protein
MGPRNRIYQNGVLPTLAAIALLNLSLNSYAQDRNRQLEQSETRVFISKDCILTNKSTGEELVAGALATVAAIVGPVIVSNLTGRFADMIKEKSKSPPLKSENSFSTYLFKANKDFDQLHYSGFGCVTIVNDYSFSENSLKSGVIKEVVKPGGYNYESNKIIGLEDIKSILDANNIKFSNGSPNMVFEFDFVVSDDKTAFYPRARYLFYPRTIEGITAKDTAGRFKTRAERRKVRQLRPLLEGWTRHHIHI